MHFFQLKVIVGQSGRLPGVKNKPGCTQRIGFSVGFVPVVVKRCDVQSDCWVLTLN